MYKRTRPSLPLLLATLLVASPSLYAGELRDPTRPSYLTSGPDTTAADVTKTAPSLVLTAIRLAPGMRSAMINDRSIKVGERIGDARVVAIDRYGVRLLRGTENFTLKLLPIKVKQAPKAARR